MHQLNSPQRQTMLLDRITLHRFGGSDEVANLALFPASDESTYITGGDFQVDGGIML